MTLTTVDIIAQRLFEAGCRHAFGIPGGEVLAMMEALARAGIRFTLTKHENAAGFMAEGTHHANGAPGILLATVGPGIANAFNVIANAQQDRVPLIVLSGCIDEDTQLSFTHQVFNHKAVMAPITKATFTAVEGASDLMIDKAITIATDGRAGPVYIDIPIRVATAFHATANKHLRKPLAAITPAPSTQLQEARAKLAASKKPIMVAGLDVLYDDGATDELKQFVERFQIPLVTTYKAKGILPENHPLALGGHGLSQRSDKVVLPLLESADMVLAVGYDPIEMRDGWINPWDPAKAIEICLIENTHYVHHADLSFICSIKEGLKALSYGLEPKETSWPGGKMAQAQQQLSERFRFDESWGPATVIETVRRIAPLDTIATADTGAHRILLSQIWQCHKPRSLLQSTGLCTMGCALPLALGYKLVKPDAPMIVFTGDAGLEMVLGELATMRDLKIPLVVIVFVDASLALIELKQRGTRRQNLGVDFGKTDFAKVAIAMGGNGVIAASETDLEIELQQALDGDRFTIIATPIGRKAYDGKL
ncbi:MAG: thiamine pyrophosphate-binding protein [bacterium]|nr:thiamine pyrophosphate-binding protein [bacterium]